MKRVLIDGGAGYVGCVLVPMLLSEGYQVLVLDNLMWGGTGLLGCFHNPNFEFMRGDIRDDRNVSDAMKGVDAVIHLAAIVGFPVCRKDPAVTQSINVEGTKVVSRHAGTRPVLYGSTGSNYGAQDSGIVTEETPLNPLTLYGTTKTEAERWLLEHNQCVAFRFASGFGVSPRMRLDLMVNEFVYKVLLEHYLVIYEAHFMRSFIHVRDIAGTYVFALKNLDSMLGQVYNVGDESLNCSKADLCRMIQKRINYYLHFADMEKDPDQRNCKISYDKIKRAGFKCEVSLERGIDEMIAACKVLEHGNPYSNV